MFCTGCLPHLHGIITTWPCSGFAAKVATISTGLTTASPGGCVTTVCGVAWLAIKQTGCSAEWCTAVSNGVFSSTGSAGTIPGKLFYRT